VVRGLREAIIRAGRGSPDVILVCGSFILAGEARGLLTNRSDLRKQGRSDLRKQG